MKTLKKILVFIGIIGLTSCTDAGTLQRIDKGNIANIEVYRYYYDDGSYVYVAIFKNSPNVVSTTWQQSNGKTSSTVGNVVIYENDSIQIIRKR